MNDVKPRDTLIYDGDCGLCRELVAYARAVAGDALHFRPYQQAARDHPEIPRHRFVETIFLFRADGRRYEGARAAFEVLARDPVRRAWLVAYCGLPGFAASAQAGYRWVARHRPAVHRAVRWLYGSPPLPVRGRRTAALVAAGLLASLYLALPDGDARWPVLPIAAFACLATLRAPFVGLWGLRAVALVGLLAAAGATTTGDAAALRAGVERVAPWLVLAPRRLRAAAGGALIAVHAVGPLLGDDAWPDAFLAVALAIAFLDDRTLAGLGLRTGSRQYGAGP